MTMLPKVSFAFFVAPKTLPGSAVSMAREGIAALLLILPVASSFLAPRLHFTPRQAYGSSYHLSHRYSMCR